MKTVRAIANACQKLLAKGWKVRKEGGYIRFRPPNYRGFCDCPLTALHRDRFHTPPPEFSEDDIDEVARRLHIPAFLQDIVDDAANNDVLSVHSLEDTEAARLLFLRKWNLPLDALSSSDLTMLSEKNRKLFQAEKVRRKRERQRQ